MKLKEIEELIDFIAKSGLEEVNIETEQIKLHIKKNLPIAKDTNLINPYVEIQRNMPLPSETASHLISKPQADSTLMPNAVHDSDTIIIKSPMIGTFYRSSKPDAPPFVKEGDIIEIGKIICIIEAMKLFNEIEAEISGTIISILVDDASPVEYDQPLFLIKPN